MKHAIVLAVTIACAACSQPELRAPCAPATHWLSTAGDDCGPDLPLGSTADETRAMRVRR